MSFAELFESAQEKKKKVTRSIAIASVDGAEESAHHRDDGQKKKKKQQGGGGGSDKNTKPAASRKRPPPGPRNQGRTPGDPSAAGGGEGGHPRQTKRHRPPRNNDHQHRGREGGHQRQRRQPPSEEALALSARLKELSQRKRLEEVLELYWRDDSSSSSTSVRVPRDQHHACIAVDCCSRCGNVREAERVVSSVADPSVQLQTALLKGYAHGGEMHKAEALFEAMMRHGGDDSNSNRPNIRTLNTVLRGCLWSAASSSVQQQDDNNEQVVAGGVVTSERAWRLFRDGVGSGVLDLSSYEYSVTLLCQALDTGGAEKRISELQHSNGIRPKGKAGFAVVRGDDSASVLETLAASYLTLARAHALLGNVDETWISCQRVLNAVNGSRAARVEEGGRGDDEHQHDATASTKNRRKPTTSGGKRGKSHNNDDSAGNKEARRADSNTAFRGHRLTEFEMEARRLLKKRGKRCEPLPRRELLQRLLNQLLYFSGGGTTSSPVGSQSRRKEEAIEQFRVASMHSYGGSTLLREEGLLDGGIPAGRNCLREDGSIDFESVFQNRGKMPIDIELGAGFGDWVAGQAHAQPSRNYVAVELRADRLYQIFSKSILEFPEPLRNLCVVGCDADALLRDRVRDGTISTIFVHHPEPPTQTYGEDRADVQSILAGGAEPAHMLSSSTLLAAAKCLKKKDGKLVIVTDNFLYARLISSTLARVIRRHSGLLRTLATSEARSLGLRHVESFGNSNVELYQRQHSSEGSDSSKAHGGKTTTTWFDRLWRTGAGSHAERTTRFVIIMYRGN